MKENKKIRNIIIIVIAILLLLGLIVGAILLFANGAPASSDNSYTKQATLSESGVVSPDEDNETSLEDGVFVNYDKNSQKYSPKGELGGSKTLDIIKPETSTEDDNSSTESSTTEWIDGIW